MMIFVVGFFTFLIVVLLAGLVLTCAKGLKKEREEMQQQMADAPENSVWSEAKMAPKKMPDPVV